MTAPLSAERVFNVSELTAWLGEFMPFKDGVLEEVIACLSAYSSLRAESEKLISVISFMNESELKAEAEFGSWKKEEVIWKETEAKLLAQLAKQAPLIQAVMGLDEIDFIADDWPSEKLRESADKLRSEK